MNFSFKCSLILFPFKEFNFKMSKRLAYMERFDGCPLVSSLKNASDIFELLGVPRELDRKLRVIDQLLDDDLHLIHLIEDDPRIQHVRGVIVSTLPTPKIVCNSFPHTNEIVFSDWTSNELPSTRAAEEISRLKKTINFNESEVTHAEEGTILRVFYKEKYVPKTSEPSYVDILKGTSYEQIGNELDLEEKSRQKRGQWYISTHKKIDGREFFWSGPTFLEMFETCWPGAYESGFDQSLDKEKCYVFLVSHPEGKLVCHIEKPFMKLTALFERAGQHLVRKNISEEYSDVKSLPFAIPKVLPVKNMAALNKECKNMDWRKITGILVYNKIKNTCIKIVPDDYYTRQKVRGNEPSLRTRFVKLYCKGTQRDLLRLYPKEAKEFKKLGEQLENFVSYLNRCYITRYVKKEYIKLPQPEFRVIQKVNNTFDNDTDLKDQVRYAFYAIGANKMVLMIDSYIRRPNGESDEDEKETRTSSSDEERELVEV